MFADTSHRVMNYFPLIVLFGVFALVAVRQVGGFRLHIWQITLAGALILLLTRTISPAKAVMAVNLDVIFFLFGMFVVGEALVESGYLYRLFHGFFRGARNTDGLVLLILFVMGFMSAFVMNDTVAIIGTPLVLSFAERHDIQPKLLLLSLCFAITIGSVPSPIGNPQNLLIATGGNIPKPFLTFLKYLALPTAVNLLLAYLALKLFFRNDFKKDLPEKPGYVIKDHKLALLSKVSLILLIALIIVKTLTVFKTDLDFRLTYISIISALPVILFSPRRFRILKNINWETLIFFIALFILMGAVWDSGVLQSYIPRFGADLSSVDLILILSVSLSQLLSNVPFVALFLPVANHLGLTTKGMMALAAGSTTAGNLLILGAASNVIVIQLAERKGKTITFLEFAWVGIPLTILNMIVYRIFLTLM